MTSDVGSAGATPGGQLRSLPFSAAAVIVGCVSAVIAGSALYSGFFVDWAFIWPVGGAALLGGALGVLALCRRTALPVLVIGATVGFVLYASYVLFPDATSNGLPGWGALGAVTDGVIDGLARMLTVIPPADPDSRLLVLPATLAFVAALTAVLFTRQSLILLPLLPPLIVVLIALLLSAATPHFQWQVTLVFLACALFVALLRANAAPEGRSPSPEGGAVAATLDVPTDQAATPTRRHPPLGQAVLGLPIVAIVTIGAVLAVQALPLANGGARYDPRALREPAIEIESQLNPLVEVRRQIVSAAEGRPVELFALREVSGDATMSQIRVATLDLYDGVQWGSSARFVRTGSSLPAGPPLDDPGRVTLDIELSGQMRGPFLPQAGRPVQIDAEDAAFDPVSGQLVTGVRALGGYHYELTAELATDGDLTTASPATGAEYVPLVDLPDSLTSELADFAAEIAATSFTPYAKLQAIAERLRELPYALDAAPGHSVAALARVLPTSATSEPLDARVTEEQTVAAFVIMARSLGYPARVAVGYDLPPEPIADGSYIITTAQANAWPEVAFAGRGWVPFNPTAPRAVVAATDPGPTAAGGEGDEPPLEVRPGPFGVEVSLDDSPTDEGIGLWAVAPWAFPIVALVALAFGVLLAKRTRRHRRATLGSAADRVLGAWREVASNLQQHGLPVRPTMTSNEVAAVAAVRFGGDTGAPVFELATLVSAALFAPVEPPEENAVSAWELEGELHAALSSRRSWIVRAGAHLDPRPLLPTSWRFPKFRMSTFSQLRRGSA